MVMRNWFCTDDMVLFEEEPYTQCFFSLEDGIIFKVSEKDEHTVIVQYCKGESGYSELYSKYYVINLKALNEKNLT